eukprot:CAMPEP_0170432610 /NCGR_PEP_ID=MMETSP0117_2-20130122/42045_1 /TAXON_ID=400756 /ORGANISM="Durinskia baltica, Strain CSIRO CS-38" /LENGTH=89 /DNA_ID=CAMNT_0010692281 /DNA_START=128 /DNA_END=397 /DNA_ORIENTATION=+
MNLHRSASGESEDGAGEPRLWLCREYCAITSNICFDFGCAITPPTFPAKPACSTGPPVALDSVAEFIEMRFNFVALTQPHYSEDMVVTL